MKFLFAIIFTLVTLPCFAANSVVILAYQRIDEPNHPETNISSKTFTEHMQIIENEGFTIISLDRAINAFKNKTSLPEKSVVITFDGNYASTKKSISALNKSKTPFTIFLPMGNIGNDSNTYIDQKSLKKWSKKSNVTLALTSYDYNRSEDINETITAEQINRSKVRFREFFKSEPLYYAYPFGEYTMNDRETASKHFQAALALHSGPAWHEHDLLQLPRFAMTENYADPDRFKLILQTLPLEVTDLVPSAPILDTKNPGFGFTVKNESIENISCYLSGEGKLLIEAIGDERAEVRLNKTIEDRRIRLNCTAPIHDNGKTYWKWFGRLFTTQ